ncbi:TRAP transporter small permease [Anaeromicropila populeti]|uniref:TRAP-type C4-dicarboxylate transport system, small permease component n=1 Tax=Anaeromicropila populeti TaxID=37658 RepID=A0A1I6K8N9_9FIRM|nr:TRAP transporter small permease subunit [Anaeromicropila populeti]SFR87567.1 TRAP-type C4-dicarboxylate transport system, small permease component [Anaeromicropila populeti]
MRKLRDWIDRISTIISAAMCGAMMIILLCNVILRYIPGVGGFKWYMESSQYLNVWAMLIIGAQITVRGSHLRVEVMDAIVSKSPIAKKIVKAIHGIAIITFYCIAAYAGYQLATRAKQVVSTMPSFKMGQVYMMMPVACVICAVAALLDMLIIITEKTEGGKSA